MKKIVLVSNTSWALFNFRKKLIEYLIYNDIQVYCIANKDDYTNRLIALGVHFVKSDLQNKGINPFSDLQYSYFLLRTYKKIKPDFVFHYTVKPNIYGSLAARLLNLKSVAFVSGTGFPFQKKNLINFIVKGMYRTAGKNCTSMWFINHDDLELFVEEGLVNRSKTKLLPGEGVDVEFFSRNKPYPQNNNNFTFLLSSRLIWDKGIGVYVEAARQIREKYPWVKFQLLGYVDTLGATSIKKSKIDEWVDEGVIEYLGGTSDVKKFLMDIHCFVMPSYYREGIPKTLLEACSLEIPVITTDNTGCRDVINHNYNGLLCEPRSAESLYTSMEHMINASYDSLKAMGENGRRKVIAEFNDEIVLEFYTTQLRNLISFKNIREFSYLSAVG